MISQVLLTLDTSMSKLGKTRVIDHQEQEYTMYMSKIHLKNVDLLRVTYLFDYTFQPMMTQIYFKPTSIKNKYLEFIIV